MAPGRSPQGSQKPTNGLNLEPDDPSHTIQLHFLTETLTSHLRMQFLLVFLRCYTEDRRPELLNHETNLQ